MTTRDYRPLNINSFSIEEQSQFMDLLARNREYWDRKGNWGDCWMWGGPDNYASWGRNGVTYRAHRVSYALMVGAVPPHMQVLHQCDRKGCVNPKHLFLGTYKDNKVDDMRKMGITAMRIELDAACAAHAAVPVVALQRYFRVIDYETRQADSDAIHAWLASLTAA